jgi:hypothetical protein
VPDFLKNLLKDPKFDAAAIIVIWVIYIIGQNFKLDPIKFHLVPFMNPLTVPVSEIVIGSIVFGCLATLAAQYSLRRRRASKPISSSAPAPVSNSTVT